MIVFEWVAIWQGNCQDRHVLIPNKTCKYFRKSGHGWNRKRVHVSLNFDLSKEELIRRKIVLLDKNERIGSAIATVSDILDKFSKTSGSNLYMASFISSVHVVRAEIT